MLMQMKSLFCHLIFNLSLFTISCKCTAMDYKDCSLEESKSITSINRYEEQGLMVAPLNYYKTLSDQIGDYIMEQINISDHSNSRIHC